MTSSAGTPEDRLASAERSARSAEVLRRLKPDEASALLLKAEGHSYGEIGERYGWTYTKVLRLEQPTARRGPRSCPRHSLKA
jgi:DNA-directed RNA polymerase specialized sigma24 family protein